MTDIKTESNTQTEIKKNLKNTDSSVQKISKSAEQKKSAADNESNHIRENKDHEKNSRLNSERPKQRQNYPHQNDRNKDSQRSNRSKKPSKFKKNNQNNGNRNNGRSNNDRSRHVKDNSFDSGTLSRDSLFSDSDALSELIKESYVETESSLYIDTLFDKTLNELIEIANEAKIVISNAPNRNDLINELIDTAFKNKRPLKVRGLFEEIDNGHGIITLPSQNYRISPMNTFVASAFIKKFGLKRGNHIEALIHPHRENEACPFLLRIEKINDFEPEHLASINPFEDLIPYYPLERILLETNPKVSWDNASMRIVDLLTPIGFGQRGLIVAPPRTGKTVLLQCIANSIAENNPDTKLLVLLIDERPEEVTDFKRNVKGEVISSTFDETAKSHVHAAEMVIEKARRMVEHGQHVVILLDSITRLARAYNTLMPSGGKILSGGVEANALQKPKRFFGSARNIEGGGSLTIIATALVETGSRMDEVIFEEFKGTGNMELHLDRALVDKRIFPSLNLEKSGTRKEELLYHPDEMTKVYSLRRAMKGVPSPEAMEMLIQRVKKTKTNPEFLISINR